MSIWPKIVALLSLWGLVVFIVVVVDPGLVRDIGIVGSYLPLTILVFAAMLYTSMLILHRFPRALMISLLTTLALELAFQRLMYWYIGVTLLATLVLIITFPHRKDLTSQDIS
jgi:hypothetical protein